MGLRIPDSLNTLSDFHLARSAESILKRGPDGTLELEPLKAVFSVSLCQSSTGRVRFMGIVGVFILRQP